MQAFVITSAGVMEGKTLTALNLSWLLAQTDGVARSSSTATCATPAPPNTSASTRPSGSPKSSAAR